MNTIKKTRVFDLKQYPVLFKKYIDEIVQKYRDNNQNLVVVGMHYPDPNVGKGKFIKPFHLDIKADVKICLNPGVETIVKQYIRRELDHMSIEDIWKIPDLLRSTCEWLATFKKEKYKFMTPRETAAVLSKLK